jgi:p-cumate 2,3-dioxygenase subunit beta
MSTPKDASAVSRADIEDFLFHEADLLDSWRLDEWLDLLTEDAACYVPPNDKSDAHHRSTLFTIADDAARLRARVIRVRCSTPPSSARWAP